jgi:iron(III) transport system ATP-binding protein
MMLALERVGARFGAVVALDDVSLAAARGEVLCLLGPSGSGKSTLLRLVAGIERPSAGRILIDGAEVAGPRAFVEPEERHVGMVFQDYALFPHLTVAQNVAFGLRRGGGDGAALLERFGLARLAASYPHALSGGERQRVALARALAPNPRVLLMDEPFSSLDSRLRDEVRLHALKLVRGSGTTTVIVTHDPDEALRIADRIALLDRGRLVQVGTPEELYHAPRTLFAAQFFGDVAALRGRCEGGRLATPLGSFPAAQLEVGAAGIACLRPQHFAISAEPTALTGRVVDAEFRGDTRQILVLIDGLADAVPMRVPGELRPSSSAVAPGAVVHFRILVDDVPVVAAG